MKNVFFKREDAYRPSIWRQKKRLVLILFLICAILFFFYQFLFMSQLSKSELIIEDKAKLIYNTAKPISVQNIKVADIKVLLRGTRLSDLSKYKPNSNGKFTCFKSKLEIDFSMVNDDFCDCPEDGSDEPGTDACNEGHFYCKYQPRHLSGKENVIPSGRVNDGVCDCCDGSDEWNTTKVHDVLPLDVQKKIGTYQVPCPNLCLTPHST